MSKRITRRTFGLLTGGAVLAGSPLTKTIVAFPSASSSEAYAGTLFPFGTHVYREPSLPLEQFREDLPILRRLGFNMVKIQEVWGNDEQREGEINLSKVAHVVSEARQNGLRVYFGVTMEQAPAWLWKKYPDSHLVYNTGQLHNDTSQYVLPADGKPGPCWHHPGARAAGIRFVEAVGKEIGKYENIEVWNVWQEIGFWPMRPGTLGFCFCHHTLAEYRKWLRAKYKALKNLNDTWRTGYGDWDEVEPPRFSAAVPPTIDWRYFMDDVYLADALHWKAEAFRRSDPRQRPILAHVASVSIGSGRDWRYAEAVDMFGSSGYPTWRGFHRWDADRPTADKPVPKFSGLYHELWERILLNFDYARCATPAGQLWTAELQGGPIVKSLIRGRVPDPSDIRRWVFGCLAAGARAVCFWNHRAEIFWPEAYGFGLLDLQGDRTSRAEEAGRLAKAINVEAQLFTKGEVPRASVAIVINEDLWHFAEAATSDMSEHLVCTIRGLYRALLEEGIPVDFVDAGRIADPQKRYKALILPFPLALSPSLVESLRTYVREGGLLISEACPGRVSHYGFGFPREMAPGLEELFGAKHKRVVLIREPGNNPKWTDAPRTYGDAAEYEDFVGMGNFASFRVFPAYYFQTFTPTTAQPILLTDDGVAGCTNRFGKGCTFLIGTLLGHAPVSYNDRRNGAFLAAVLAQAEVTSDRVGKLQVRKRVWGNKTALFLFNLTPEPVEETVPVAHWKSVKDLLGDDLAVSGGRTKVKVEPLDIRCLVLEA